MFNEDETCCTETGKRGESNERKDYKQENKMPTTERDDLKTLNLSRIKGETQGQSTIMTNIELDR